MVGSAGGARAGWWHRWGHHSHVNPLFSLPSNVLMSRATLLAETSVLQQQNSELCVLLEEYISSRVSVSPSSPAAGDTPARVPHTEIPDMGSLSWRPHCCRAHGVFFPAGEQRAALPPHKVDGLELGLSQGSAVSAQGQGRDFLGPELCLEPGLINLF